MEMYVRVKSVVEDFDQPNLVWLPEQNEYVPFRRERTCQMAYYEPCSGDEYYPTECYTCSECNNTVFTGKPRYCPNCGAKVVEDD